MNKKEEAEQILEDSFIYRNLLELLYNSIQKEIPKDWKYNRIIKELKRLLKGILD